MAREITAVSADAKKKVFSLIYPPPLYNFGILRYNSGNGMKRNGFPCLSDNIIKENKPRTVFSAFRKGQKGQKPHYTS